MSGKPTGNMVNSQIWESTVLHGVGGTSGGKPKNTKNSSFRTEEQRRFEELSDNVDGGNNPTPTHDFKISLQKARNAKGWTQKDLASKMGMKPVDINSWEAGKGSPPTGEQRAKLQKILGVKFPKM
tara:strand:- start:670 stop:1047 length:378 start_codon:yes stop_codon:yes gene_type:complete